jgi:hypothetical protein
MTSSKIWVCYSTFYEFAAISDIIKNSITKLTTPFLPKVK